MNVNIVQCTKGTHILYQKQVHTKKVISDKLVIFRQHRGKLLKIISKKRLVVWQLMMDATIMKEGIH